MDTCIVCVSQAIEPFDLGFLLAQSRRNKARWGITGVTFCVRDSSIQALEGERQALTDLCMRIKADPRHHQVEHILPPTSTQVYFQRETWVT